MASADEGPTIGMMVPPLKIVSICPVLASARAYFRSAGPAYAFFGGALVLYFASQGSGRILGPVLAQTVRLLVVAVGGGWLLSRGAQAGEFFTLVGVSLTAYGLASAYAVWRADWEPPGVRAPKA